MTRRQKASTLACLWLGIGATCVWSVQSTGMRLGLLGIALGVTIHVARLKVAVPEPASPAGDVA